MLHLVFQFYFRILLILFPDSIHFHLLKCIMLRTAKGFHLHQLPSYPEGRTHPPSSLVPILGRGWEVLGSNTHTQNFFSNCYLCDFYKKKLFLRINNNFYLINNNNSLFYCSRKVKMSLKSRTSLEPKPPQEEQPF